MALTMRPDISHYLTHSPCNICHFEASYSCMKFKILKKMKTQNIKIITILIAIALLLGNQSFAVSQDTYQDNKDTKIIKVQAPIIKILSETLNVGYEDLALFEEKFGDIRTISFSINNEITLVLEDDSPDCCSSEYYETTLLEDWMFEELKQPNDYEVIEDWMLEELNQSDDYEVIENWMLEDDYYDDNAVIEDWMLDTEYWG